MFVPYADAVLERGVGLSGITAQARPMLVMSCSSSKMEVTVEREASGIWSRPISWTGEE